MTCTHIGIKNRTLGQLDNCANCGLEIVWTDNNKWEWLYSVNNKKVRQWRIHHLVTKIAGDNND